MKRQNVRTLALIVVTFTYLLVGAAIFDALESADEESQKIEMDSKQDKYVEKYNITKDDFERIYWVVLRMKPLKAGTQWKFAGAFYFATTVITTIGYGHSTPKTDWGKIFCMIYALPGIPLTIIMFQSIGERMNMFITFMLQSIKKRFSGSTSKISQTKLILISFNFVTIVVIFGALIFRHYENWSFFNSVYYCFITLTTIGFGDLVALQKDDYIAKRPDYVAFSLIFILFGLTVVSSVMNLLVLRFLTMNTDDERRDEIVAVVNAIDQSREFGSKSLFRDNEILRVSKPLSNSSINHIVSDNSSSCTCLCNTPFQLRKWINTFICVNNESRQILTRSCTSKTSASKRNSNSNTYVHWKVKSYRMIMNDKRKRYTVTRAPAPVRHLAESGYIREYHCSPPTIKVQTYVDNQIFHEEGRIMDNISNSSNIMDLDNANREDSCCYLNGVGKYCRQRSASY